MDHQLKIHGKRTELGEINAILASSPLLSRCVTVVKQTGKFKDKFVAYIAFNQTGEKATLIKQLDDFAKQALPSHVQIGGYVILHDFPKLSSGKIDISQLSHREDTEQIHTVKRGHITPHTPQDDHLMQSLLLTISEVLNLPKTAIETDASFHELGGDSFDAIRLRNKLDLQFNISPPIPVLLHKTPEALYQLVKQKKEAMPTVRGGLFKIREGNLGEDDCTVILHSGYGIVSQEMQLNPFLTGAIYAIDNPYFGAEIHPFNSLHDMAAHYFELILKENSPLPNRIIGWSLGGLLAMELATMIHRQWGYKPDVILLDAYNWEVINTFHKENGLVNPLSDAHNMDYLLRQSGNIDPALSRQLENETKHALVLLENHTPTFYGGNVVLLQAATLSQDIMELDPKLRQALAEDNGWKGVVNPDQFQVLVVEGDHYTLFNQDYNTELEKVFKIAITSGRRQFSKATFSSSIFSQSPSNKRDENCSNTPVKGCG